MPVPTRIIPEKNIWVAAGDGDLSRVRELVEQQSFSPNVPDENTYTPMHAAASYGHIGILEYLLSKGGDVNISDGDGDTPLYVVENLETARWLVEHGAIVNQRNNEDISPVAALAEDFSEVSEYLRSVSLSAAPAPSSDGAVQNLPSQHAQNQITESLTTSLLDNVQDVMQRAEAEERDPDEELRRVVGRTVLEGMATGYGMSRENHDREADDENDTKRSRTDES